MNELSLHILDICQNSIKANSKLIQITVDEDILNNKFTIIIEDDGFGMDEATLTQASDPFFTTRSTRKIGLGISFFKMAAEMSDGTFKIESFVNKGTKITAQFAHNHIDRAPLGDIEDTLSILILNEEEIDIYYKHIFNDAIYEFDTRKVREVLDGIPFTEYEVILWIKSNIRQGIDNIHKEETK